VPPALGQTLAPITERWQALSGGLRSLITVGAVGAVLVIGGMWVMNNVFVDYQVLFGNLSAEDASAVIDALRTAKVPYTVGKNGEVLVPEPRVHEWRLRLASQGVPSGGAVGFEIFDKNQFGLTDFSQRLNFQRALQGELARTIGQLKEVQLARVHLALPAPRVFSAQDKPPSASVVLRLRPGAALRPDQVRGIVHLVTASVEGLSPDRVTVVESSGRMLASGVDRMGGLSTNQQEARTLVEQDVERRVQSLLDPIVGVGRSAVRVAALVNLDRIERTEERFDPKPLVRTQHRATEQTQGNSLQPTAVGEPPKPAENTANTRSQRESEQTTYEIARTVEKTLVTPGDVKRLSVAVLLDVPIVNGVRAPRPDPEIERIKRLVASAAGVRAERNDEIEVLQVSFDPTVAPSEPTGAAPVPAAKPAFRQLPAWAYAVAAAVAVLVIGFLLWRARRRQRALLDAVTAAIDGADADAKTALPAVRPRAGAPADAELPAPVDPLQLRARAPEQEALKARVIAAAKEHPDRMAQIIRAWMARPRSV
jgi:flagellar M-ring protein FliF